MDGPRREKTQFAFCVVDSADEIYIRCQDRIRRQTHTHTVADQKPDRFDLVLILVLDDKCQKTADRSTMPSML